MSQFDTPTQQPNQKVNINQKPTQENFFQKRWVRLAGIAVITGIALTAAVFGAGHYLENTNNFNEPQNVSLSPEGVLELDSRGNTYTTEDILNIVKQYNDLKAASAKEYTLQATDAGAASENKYTHDFGAQNQNTYNLNIKVPLTEVVGKDYNPIYVTDGADFQAAVVPIGENEAFAIVQSKNPDGSTSTRVQKLKMSTRFNTHGVSMPEAGSIIQDIVTYSEGSDNDTSEQILTDPEGICIPEHSYLQIIIDKMERDGTLPDLTNAVYQQKNEILSHLHDSDEFTFQVQARLNEIKDEEIQDEVAALKKYYQSLERKYKNNDLFSYEELEVVKRTDNVKEIIDEALTKTSLLKKDALSQLLETFDNPVTEDKDNLAELKKTVTAYF